MWFLPAAFSLVAALVILLAFGVGRWLPDELPFTLSVEAVAGILSILASSLLTVAVFALSTIVSALSAVTQTTTPRAVPLIVSDRRAQTSVSVFIGAFLFSIVGIIGVNAGFYSGGGRLVLFVATLAVVVIVIAALIRWIGQISAIGRVSHTIDRVEEATINAFHAIDTPRYFGCMPRTGDPQGAPVLTDKIGYVQYFDTNKLQDVAEKAGLHVHILARPGTYVDPQRPLMMIAGQPDEECEQSLRDAFIIGGNRTFDRDPRYGLIVLNEIAGRALSPAVNDPGTAIDVVGTLVRVLMEWETHEKTEELKYPRLSVEPLTPADLMEDAFRPIARDGAGHIEVLQRLMTGLETLATSNTELSEPARRMARDAAARARAALKADSDRAALDRMMGFAETADD
ncbi:hypothetical protein GCM10007989_26230 [Devosia pacifica]|uniref:DUF2254 domain-containing protein n=2 Tax=Devosia pacifica TaxID=1335967 RepID=A0A918S913_9HYPH|nr:hypothetical protein GCM10007989_26230 [Devosia pacifica]